MIRWGLENVRGTVIGEVTPFSGELLYGGRPQGQKVDAATPGEVKETLKSRMQALKEKYQGICYDTGEQWEMRLNW